MVLDDGGRTVPSGERPAGLYTISFADRRSHAAHDEHSVLRFAVANGPLYVFFGMCSSAKGRRVR